MIRLDNVRLSFTALKEPAGHYANCPENVVQWRPVMNNQTGLPDILWRTADCNTGRWHYGGNRCNCADDTFAHSYLYMRYYRGVLGYRFERAYPERGSWRRDGYFIAHTLKMYRELLASERATNAIARAATGPRPLKGEHTCRAFDQRLYFKGKPIYFDNEGCHCDTIGEYLYDWTT